jgi:hypothetical protein
LPAAQKHILLRRVYLDLIGLPPTRKQLHAFLNDKSPNAYENVVKRLLKSPQYGERWGRHWMDVWRYSDWYGRRQVNDVRNSYPHIWRWRDWIIQSLNDDKGYDAMIREMLAADELHPADDSRIAALGFIVRNWFSLNYDTWKQDLVEHTGKAFLGLRLNCAHCHDHKYDPISQEEYFRFRAFFEPLELRHDRVPGGPALKKYLRYTPSSGGSLKPIKAGLARVYDFELNAKTYMYRLGDARNRFDRPPVTPGAPAILNGDRLKIEPVKLPPVAWYPGLKKFAQRAEVAVLKAKFKTAGMKQNPVRAYLVAVQARIAADNARFQLMAPNGDNLARSAARAERLARLTVIRVQESVATKALKAAQQKPKPDVKAIKKAKSTLAAIKAKIVAAEKQLKTVSSTYTPFGPQYPKTSTGRRRALANWIADTNNPLTARVAVNHIWMRHFGTPLVQSVFDFGRAGKRPTHPQLLDWLAVELMENRWSMKHIHRLIVTSNTYRMSSRPGGKPHPNVRIDKDNLFLWKFPRRRMQGEIIRDSLLHIAGVLDTTLGGPEIDPKQEAKSFRRSLYFAIYPEAGGTMPFLTLFDPPNPADCYRRSESIVPQQALALSNSKLVLNLTRKLAGRLAQGISETENTKFITAAFEQILSRSPTSAETCVCLEFLKSQTALYKNSGIKSITSVSQRSRESLVRVLLNHNDFVTVH